MNDFEYECMQRKRLANQAKYRKRGNKSKKCSLPSDGMTHKQWKERCGQILSYNLSKPISWSDFKNLPVSAQTEYITRLQSQYGVTAVDLAKMFGVTPITVRKHVDANELGVSFPKGHAMGQEKRDAWSSFITGDLDSDMNQENIDKQDTTEPQNIDDAVDSNEVQDENEEKSDNSGMKMSSFTVRFDGAISVDMIANSLKMILGNHSSGSVEVVCHIA